MIFHPPVTANNSSLVWGRPWRAPLSSALEFWILAGFVQITIVAANSRVGQPCYVPSFHPLALTSFQLPLLQCSLSLGGRRGGLMKISPSERSTQSLILSMMTHDVSLPWWLPSARSFSLSSVLFWVLNPRLCVCVYLLHHWAASPACAFILGLFLCLLPPLRA